MLLDEMLDICVRRLITGHELVSAARAGLDGIKNGALMRQAEAKGFEPFITIDRGIPFEQNLTAFKLVIILLEIKSSLVEH